MRRISSLASLSSRNATIPLILVLLLISSPSVLSSSTTASSSQQYRVQQNLYLQSRSLQLRQALIDRGIRELEHSQMDPSSTVKQPIDWECALSTEENPKSCLYSFDAPLGAKVIGPRTSTGDTVTTNPQYITLVALNRLRRTDPTKIEPLWHSQYAILSSWFHPDHLFSLYTYMSPIGTLLAFLLDSPVLLGTAICFTTTIAFLITMPVWEKIFQAILTHPFIWLQWHQWGRFVHAALPLKLLLGQMAWKGVSSLFLGFYNRLRTQLIEWECQILEDCLPLTVLEENPDSTGDEVDSFSGDFGSDGFDDDVDDEDDDDEY